MRNKKKIYPLFLSFVLLAALFFQLAGEAAATRATPGFAIGSVPFRFLGGFVPGWHWGTEYWSEAVDHDLITSARSTGITVMHLMLPLFEGPLGVYDETKLQKLDHFIDSAYNANVYVMPSFIQAYSETLVPGSTEYPYYHPRSIEGIIKDPNLRQAFKNRIAVLLNRQNTYNGRFYKDDPTIMAWIVCDEPISGPFNYPNGLPQITLAELTDWFQETATYIKSLDSKHLVTVWSQPAIQAFFGWTLDYLQALGIPEFDFMYTEDADLSIVSGLTQGYNCDGQTPQYMLDQFLPGKPVAFHPAFTSGCWDTNIICDGDFTFQSTNLNLAIPEYFAIGGNAVLIENWGSDLYPSIPDWAQCRTYTDSDQKIIVVAQTQSVLVNPDGHPVAPLGFVHVIYGLNAAKSGSGSGTIASSPAGISCGSDCSEAFSQGTVVTLTAQANPGSVFGGWNGGGCLGTDPCAISMTTDVTVSATFNIGNIPPELSTDRGTIGAQLTITGSGFGAKKGKVLIEGTATKINAWTPTLITGEIKKPLPTGIAYDMVLQLKEPKGVDPITLSGALTMMAPEITSVIPGSGAEGTVIEITGTFFSTKKGKVYLGEKKCKVLSWGMDKITFVVPKKMTPGSYNLTVTNKVGSNSVSDGFTIIFP
ncbi:MAG: hypothetical protein H6Q53_442 [Deltaproteobacteria bacterium]|nr:hypothetical protein [Deltaproteobacteria bacterium]